MNTEEVIAIDKSDLSALLEIRFGDLPERIRDQIQQLNKRETLERLILIAANVPDWKTLEREFCNADGAFGIVGENYNPVPLQGKGMVE